MCTCMCNYNYVDDPCLLSPLLCSWVPAMNGQDLYSCSQTRFYLKELFFSCDEDILAQPLARVQREFPKVQLGSYPDSSSETNYLVRVALESSDRELVEKVGLYRTYLCNVYMYILHKQNLMLSLSWCDNKINILTYMYLYMYLYVDVCPHTCICTCTSMF